MARQTKVARTLKYGQGAGTLPGPPGNGHDNVNDEGNDGGDDGGDDGGAGVREPRRPIPPTPSSGAGALTLPRPMIESKLPNPARLD